MVLLFTILILTVFFPVLLLFSDLRNDKGYLADHVEATTITSAQVGISQPFFYTSSPCQVSHALFYWI